VLLRIPGVETDDVDDNRRTALSYACLFGKPNVMKLLIASNADLKKRDMFENSYAHLVTTAVAFDVLQEELGTEAMLAALKQTNLFGWTPLAVARALHTSDLVSAMLAHGAVEVTGGTVLVSSWQYRISVPYLEGMNFDCFTSLSVTWYCNLQAPRMTRC
jgi:ankyrin repeat protein